MLLLYRRTNKAEYTIHRGYIQQLRSRSAIVPWDQITTIIKWYIHNVWHPPHANHMVLSANKLELQITQRIRNSLPQVSKFDLSLEHQPCLTAPKYHNIIAGNFQGKKSSQFRNFIATRTCGSHATPIYANSLIFHKKFSPWNAPFLPIRKSFLLYTYLYYCYMQSRRMCTHACGTILSGCGFDGEQSVNFSIVSQIFVIVAIFVLPSNND